MNQIYNIYPIYCTIQTMLTPFIICVLNSISSIPNEIGDLKKLKQKLWQKKYTYRQKKISKP